MCMCGYCTHTLHRTADSCKLLFCAEISITGHFICVSELVKVATFQLIMFPLIINWWEYTACPSPVLNPLSV